MEKAEQDRAIAILQKAYDAFNQGDIAAAVGSLDPHIEWTEPESFPGEGRTTDRQGRKLI